MRQRTDRPAGVRFQFHRLKAVLALRCRSFEDFYRALPVTSRHAHFVMSNARMGSAALLGAIRRELGEPGWLFSTGQIDTLRDEQPASEAATHDAA